MGHWRLWHRPGAIAAKRGPLKSDPGHDRKGSRRAHVSGSPQLADINASRQHFRIVPKPAVSKRSKQRSYSITSSAMASSPDDTSRPSALAVLRLIISWYFVGFCTGRSAGFSPLRMRSMYPAARRDSSE